MGKAKITYVTDDGTGDYCGLYIDGILIMDCEVYELDAYEVLRLLKTHGLLDAEIERKKIEFENHVEFPDTLDDY